MNTKTLTSKSLAWPLLAVILLHLGACGSSPPVRYFSLGSDYRAVPESARGTPLVSLGPLRFPEYLERTQFVTRGANGEMLVDDFTRWAEPLDQAMLRAIAAYVDASLDDVVVIAFPAGGLTYFTYRVAGNIDRFDVDQNRQAEFSVQWGIMDVDEGIIVPPRRSRFTATAASASPADTVAALSETIRQFSQEIVEALSALPTDTGAVTDD